jgi:hypothetical protein
MQGVLQQIVNGLAQGLKVYVSIHGPKMVQQVTPVVTQAIQQGVQQATPVVTQAIQQGIQQATPVVTQAIQQGIQSGSKAIHSKSGQAILQQAQSYLVQEGSREALKRVGLLK